MRPGPAGWHRGGSGLVKQHVDVSQVYFVFVFVFVSTDVRRLNVTTLALGATEPWFFCVISAFLCFPAVRTVCACACLSVLSRRRGLCACLSS